MPAQSVCDSVWLAKCQKPFMYAHASAGQNPELRTLFYRLARLFSLPLTAVFVFDGPNRPSIKRGKKVIKAQHWLTAGAMRLIGDFGFQWHLAPGEAEVELALMNQLGLIDAIMTDDGDAFAFGAETVIRNPSVKFDHDTVMVYTYSALASHPDVKLTRGGMLLMALLSGGDYPESNTDSSSEWTTRLRASHFTWTGLLRAGNRLMPLLRLFLHGWRNNLRWLLCSDPNGYLGRRHVALASTIPDTFPTVDILRAYVYPATSSPEALLDVGFCGAISFDLARLARTCEQYFTWGDNVTNLLKKFEKMVWPGVVLRLLMAECVITLERAHQLHEEVVASLLDSIKISQSRIKSGVSEFKLQVLPTPLIPTTLSELLGGFLGSNNQPADHVAAAVMSKYWIPSCVLAQARQPRSLAASSGTIISHSPLHSSVDGATNAGYTNYRQSGQRKTRRQ
ncbi:Flap endonuclease GEN 1 [Grifola frondosa]|uniref:Flap endonuclease GEN 1 n=1 Tax=Grifola frondosa TaxID=5627 RepID=A0A1C7MUP0_GRIFR|nr:Flap endonuclease GEN 1 [Grifola frondosa]